MPDDPDEQLASDDLRDDGKEASVPPSGLVLVSTPIGNLADISGRAKATLARADLVLCEDTRTTARLFAAIGLGGVTLAPLHDHNEEQRIPAVLGALRSGKLVALVSDAGTPLVSDPGFRLVRAVVAEGLSVTATPGPNAAVMALTLSGLPPHPFLFLGFPPVRDAARRASFATLRAAERAGLSATLIWHEAPHRLADMLADATLSFGNNREAAVARELTKRFEEVRRGDLASLAAWYAKHDARGEVTVVVAPAPADAPDAEALDDRLRAAMGELSLKDAAALVATATGLPRKVVYARALALMG